MACHGGPDIVEDNLVLYVDAANSKSYSGSGVTWTDVIGGNDITLTGGPSFDSTDGGGSIVFDGSDDQGTNDSFSIDNIDDNGGSLEVWCKITDTSGYRHIAGWRNTHSFFILLLNNSGNVEARTKWGDGGSSDYQDVGGSGYWSDASYWANNWNCAVLTLDRSDNKSRFYLNGSLVQTSSSTIGAIGTNNSFELMRPDNFTAGTSAGKLSQVRVYGGKALSAAEVKQNYDANKRRYK
tara:strand:- start:1600 stop:2313 length:714 start_codon:yes stop_codon:yes gene_type:complete